MESMVLAFISDAAAITIVDHIISALGTLVAVCVVLLIIGVLLGIFDG